MAPKSKQELIDDIRKISEFALDDDNNLLSVSEQKRIQDEAKSWFGDEFEYKPFVIDVNNGCVLTSSFPCEETSVEQKCKGSVQR